MNNNLKHRLPLTYEVLRGCSSDKKEIMTELVKKNRKEIISIANKQETHTIDEKLIIIGFDLNLAVNLLLKLFLECGEQYEIISKRVLVETSKDKLIVELSLENSETGTEVAVRFAKTEDTQLKVTHPKISNLLEQLKSKSENAFDILFDVLELYAEKLLEIINKEADNEINKDVKNTTLN